MDLFDLDSVQMINDFDSVGVRFRMRDAVRAGNSFVLPEGTYELSESGNDSGTTGTDKDEQTAVSVVLSRAQARTLDF
ncbi:hypothetical protein DL991_40830 [Amycolatopsis sp. WAC 01375]|uniref:hypothetical protein n=1 Tax=Amycolatopsis sp. WAC 01375 TaxID=2203194 RepID=UPI000F7A8DC4|nr:hypothetical protein [Amycolatopsis sp. WAC 01375]RSM68927.1 hypothetical protein DL991_40830 [Amycolatopsis sp. WAC 01375]